jgi:hypothetical protein
VEAIELMDEDIIHLKLNKKEVKKLPATPV